MRKFLIDYPDYTVVFSIGNYKHDTCLFIRKSDGVYESVLFDPSKDNRVHNVEVFLSKFNLGSMRGYNARGGNKVGWCSGYVWKEMHSIMCLGTVSPFSRANLLQYNRASRLYE